jgi:hypothetical protein
MSPFSCPVIEIFICIAEFPYQLLNIRGKPWITLRHPSQFDIVGLKRIIENKDKIGFNIHRK